MGSSEEELPLKKKTSYNQKRSITFEEDICCVDLKKNLQSQTPEALKSPL